LIEQTQTPKRLRLQFADTPVLDAIAEVAKQSGYAVELTGDRAAVSARKISFSSDTMTFWEAVDAIGKRGGVTLPPSPTPPPAVTTTTAVQQLNMIRGPRFRAVRVGPVGPSAAQEHIALVPGATPLHVSCAGACRVE